MKPDKRRVREYESYEAKEGGTGIAADE